MKKLAVVTGATGGIGTALMHEICKIENISLYGLARSYQNVEKDNFPDNIRFAELDFSEDKADAVDLILEAIRQAALGMDEIVLLLTASTIVPIVNIGKMCGREQQNIVINILSQVRLINGITAVADNVGCGLRIIQFDSGAAYRPIKGWALYCSAKAYISMFLQVLSIERPDFKIVLLDPGVVDTKMQEYIRSASDEDFPDVDLFQTYKEKNKLKDAMEVAKLTMDRYVLKWTAKSIKEQLS